MSAKVQQDPMSIWEIYYKMRNYHMNNDIPMAECDEGIPKLVEQDPSGLGWAIGNLIN